MAGWVRNSMVVGGWWWEGLWLASYVADWLSAGFMSGWMYGWLACYMTANVVDWLSGSLALQVDGCQPHRLINWVVWSWLAMWLACPLADVVG